MKTVIEFRKTIIIVCLICMTIALILAILVTISIASPINRLKNTMQQIGEDNMDTRFIDDMNGEVGILGQIFNLMIIRIQKLIATVYKAEILKKAEIIRRKEAELDALQMQINPHFLYNTLDIIRWQILAESNGQTKANDMLLAFSELLRMGTKKTYTVSLQDEIEHAKAYIRVINFDVEYEISLKAEIDMESLRLYTLPKLTLQPIIENAVNHGLVKNGEREIIISLQKLADKTVLSVRDNGIGINDKKLVKLQQELNSNGINKELFESVPFTNGIGLKNVNTRIKLYFGESYGLSIESQKFKYTCVKLTIPNLEYV